MRELLLQVTLLANTVATSHALTAVRSRWSHPAFILIVSSAWEIDLSAPGVSLSLKKVSTSTALASEAKHEVADLRMRPNKN